MAWVTIPPTATDPDAPLTSFLAKAWTDNPIAIANGDAGAPRVQDAALSTSVTSAGINWVAQRVIAATWNSVGQTVMAVHAASTTSTLVPGTTVLGSELRATNAAGRTGWQLPGTWRLQGNVSPTEGANALVPERTSIWLRIL